MLYHPKSANWSFGGYPGPAESGPSQSNMHSFDANVNSFNASSIGTASLGNTQLTTPTVGSFDGINQPEYLVDGSGFLADLDMEWYNMPQCEQVVNEFDFTGGPVELEVPDVPDVQPSIPWNEVTTFSSSFSQSQGMSQ